jgi:SAM-dependent methyltransferase
MSSSGGRITSFDGGAVSDGSLTAASWDAEYRAGRYADEGPLPFVGRIVETLRADPSAWTGTGLYVGCGNGRNYLPLLDAELDLLGLDVSQEAITQLIDRRPSAASRLICADFRSFRSSLPGFDYLIAIQVFQHGDDADVAAYFAKVATLLKPGGLFFLRVNSASTQIYHAHTVVERNAAGGFTIRYDDGPKHGLLVHFFSHAELLERLTPAFASVTAAREDVMNRSAPKTGTWAQWETIWRRRA